MGKPTQSGSNPIIALLLTLLLSSPVYGMSRAEVIQQIRETAVQEGVSPALAQAVAEMESGRELKCGQLNKTRRWSMTLHGPLGVRGAFLQTGTPEEVIWVGVKALRPRKGERTVQDILKRYNANWWRGRYIPGVMARMRELSPNPTRERSRRNE